MAKIILALAVSFLLMISLTVSVPVTYYVAPTGSDGNPGTSGSPFLTIQKAANVVDPGDTVIVREGIYTGGISCSSESALVCLGRGGTSGKLVTFRSEFPGVARLDGQGINAHAWYALATANYVRIEGFVMYNFNATSPTGGASVITLYNGGHHSEIVANQIYNIGRICTDTARGQSGIFLQQPFVTIERNLIHDVGRYASGENGCSPTTLNYQNHDHGIYVDGNVDSSGIPGANDAIVKNNIFYNIKRGWPMQIYPGNVSRLKIYNNTFAVENPYRDGHILIGSSGTNNEIKNNIFYDPQTSALRFYSGTQTSMTVSNNITFGGTIGPVTSGVTYSGNLDNTDPLFVNAGGFDFHLDTGSPAIDAGLTLTGVTTDYESIVRPQGVGYDIGAYEKWTTAPSPTPTPTPVSSPTPTPTPSNLPACEPNQIIGNPPLCTCSTKAIGKPKRCQADKP